VLGQASCGGALAKHARSADETITVRPVVANALARILNAYDRDDHEYDLVVEERSAREAAPTNRTREARAPIRRVQLIAEKEVHLPI